MRRLVQRGLGIVATSLLVAVGCGDDDDSTSNTGGATGTGGQATTGGSSAKGGSGGTSSAGSKSTGGTSSAGGGGGVGGSGDTTECETIGELCHAVDDGDGPLHECHELGHSSDPAVCHERFPSCIRACVGGEGEGAGGANAGGASAGGAGGKGGEEQSPYCMALGELCHPVSGVSAALEECHEVGHIGEAPVCEARFSECATACLAAREEAEGGGGTQGGGAGGSGNAGSDNAGGINGGGGSGGR